jgi:lipopolysaccharide transport system ATP-binding protein
MGEKMFQLFDKGKGFDDGHLNNDIVIVKNVSKKFRIPHEKKTTIRDNILGLINGKKSYDEFWALRNVSFSIKRGESVGIVGENGSGKSTLLEIIAEVIYPDEGKITTNGRIAPFLELGIGFQGDLTAKDNVYLYGSILGITKKEMDKKYGDILDFAELRKFENMKIKNFSSGMYARLAFATAVTTKPDILLLDEVLAVGDEKFQMKCRGKINEFKREGATIILVSHSLDAVQNICDRAILLEHGTLKMDNNVWNVADKYRELMKIEQLEQLEPIFPGDGHIFENTEALFRWKSKNPVHMVDHITFAIRDITNNQIGKIRVFRLVNAATEFNIPKNGLKIDGEMFRLEKGKKYRWSIGDKSAQPSKYKDSAGTVRIFSITEDENYV